MVTASSYYFNSSSDREGDASVSLGFTFAFFYNFGSLAFGSLILAIVQIMRSIIDALTDEAEKGESNAAT